MRNIYLINTLTFTVLFCFLSFYTQAATFTVTNTNDSGSGSLREAITSANANPVDADNIVFNIPITDPNYNASTGVFTISLTSLLPTISSIGVNIDGSTQPGNTNPYGPEIRIRSTTNLLYCFAFPLSGGTVNGFIINGFKYAVSITKYMSYPSGNCTVSNCYIGVNFNGTTADANDVGIVILDASNNTINKNILSGNSTSGIALRKSNANTITKNNIGTDKDGMHAIPNYYGIAIDSSSANIIGGNVSAMRNIISGNAYAGIAINSNQSHDNVVKGNYIGINILGASKSDTIPNHYGIAIEGSYGNIIGGSVSGERNIISGNIEAGIAMEGATAKLNIIKGNYIGTNIDGTDSIPNANGILMKGVSQNTIGGNTEGERNVISGNTLGGIILAYSGTRLNKISGNYIGTNYSGSEAISNHTGIYIKSNANKNTVGGSTIGERNVVSGNIEMGVIVEAADSNVIIGNYIGPDAGGTFAFKYSNDTLMQANGLMFNTGARYNVAGGYTAGERNVISGNRIYGHDIYGNSSYNLTIGNYIGVDFTGNLPLPNATGICVDGGSNHNPFINNVLSGNLAYGMFIVTTGTNYNELKGNKIGTNAAGTVPVPNQIGFIFGGGAKYNTLGGTNESDKNIISGNLFSGIEMADIGTSFNNIIGNYIGTDISGTIAIPNLHGIGIATHPSNNNIEGNLISGNNQMGIIIYENSDSNKIYSNKIGVKADGTSPLPNHRAGIVISNSSSHNIIGAPEKGNIIAHNDSAGIVISGNGSLYNTISANLIHSNTFMDIDLEPFGVNPNDPGDSDNGPNEGMNYPVIQSATYNPSTNEIFITGTIDCNTYNGPEGVRIELFQSDGSNIFGHGGSIKYLGYTIVNNNSGTWNLVSTGASTGDKITATATDIKGNTSEFAANMGMITGIAPNIAAEDISVFPNPVSDELNISISLNKESRVNLELQSIVGEQITTLINNPLPAGKHFIHYNTVQLSPGIYFLTVTENGVITHRTKVVIAK